VFRHRVHPFRGGQAAGPGRAPLNLGNRLQDEVAPLETRKPKKEQVDVIADGATIDHGRIERAVREILLAVGADADREGLRETPARVARMYAEMFAGLRADPREPLRKTFTQKYDEMVVVKDIDFESMCEHHLLPFRGKAHIAYLPNGKIVGLSKLARVVEAISRRPQVQERMTEELADLIEEELDARGVAVILEASHSCMTIRGVRRPSSICTTSAMRGGFRTNPSTRTELRSLVYGARV
jgi:GTP cyclohydrolase I